MSVKKKIKFGVIGQGHIGKRHAEMIRRNEECELIAVCDVIPKEKTGCTEFKESYYSSAEEMLAAHTDIDVVCVCTPNGLHAKHSVLVLNANKHVVCEKPMALSAKDCMYIIDLAEKKNKHVYCVMQNRYSPPSVWIKDSIEKKILGDIYMVQLNCYWNRDERYYMPVGPGGKKRGWKGVEELDGGTLFTQFSHFIDIMYWLFGDIKDIQARFNDFNHKTLTDFEDSGIVSFNFIDGGMGCINYSTSVWDTNLESSLTIIGSKGSVKIGGQYMNEVEHCHIKDYIMPILPPSSPANDYGTYKGSAANHHFVIANVVDSLKERAKPTTSVLEGLKVVEIIERIYMFKKRSK